MKYLTKLKEFGPVFVAPSEIQVVKTQPSGWVHVDLEVFKNEYSHVVRTKNGVFALKTDLYDYPLYEAWIVNKDNKNLKALLQKLRIELYFEISETSFGIEPINRLTKTEWNMLDFKKEAIWVSKIEKLERKYGRLEHSVYLKVLKNCTFEGEDAFHREILKKKGWTDLKDFMEEFKSNIYLLQDWVETFGKYRMLKNPKISDFIKHPDFCSKLIEAFPWMKEVLKETVDGKLTGSVLSLDF